MAKTTNDLPPGIKKRKTKRRIVWDVRVYVGSPEQPYLYKTFRSEGAAKTWKREQEGRKDKGDRPTADKRTLAEYLASWLKLKAGGAVIDRHMRKKAIGPRTLDDYRRLAEDWIIKPVKKGLHRVGHVRIDSLTYHTLEALYESMGEHTTVGTVKKLNRFLGQAFVELEKKGILSRNPADFASVGQTKKRSVAKSMEPDEAGSFLKAARDLAEEQEAEEGREYQVPARCWSALFHVLVGSGLRPGEAFALKWTEVDLNDVSPALKVEHNLVRVRGVKGYTLEDPKTARGERTVPLLPSVVKELGEWKKRQRRQRMQHANEWRDSNFVFTTSKGTPLHGARRAFERLCARAELGKWDEEPKREHATGPVKAREFIPGFRIYDCRHTFGTNAFARGIPANIVADWMGHDDPAFTVSKYGHALKSSQKESVAKLEATFFKLG
jgi:integrase